MYGSNKFDHDLDTHDEFLDFCSGNQENLTAAGVTVNDATALAAQLASTPTLSEVDAAKFIANAVNVLSSTAAGVHSVYLPPAVKGTHLAVNVTGQLDDTNKLTFHADDAIGTVKQSGNTFCKGVIGVEGATATSVVTDGTHKNLEYVAAATNAMYGPGTQIHFYSPANHKWLVKFFPVNLGTGAGGVMTVS